MGAPFVGQIMAVPYNFAPKGWAFCNGQLLAISQNTALFSLIGTYYGGNGTSNFALPDLQGRIPVHTGNSEGPGLGPYEIGESGGGETVTLTAAELPSHSHSVAPLTSDNRRTTDRPGGAYPSVGGIYAATPDSNAPMGQVTTSTTGGSAHNNLQPYLTLSYVIALFGIFPARS